MHTCTWMVVHACDVHTQMATFVSRLQDLMDTGKLRLPNVLFVLNVDDNE